MQHLEASRLVEQRLDSQFASLHGCSFVDISSAAMIEDLTWR